MKITDLSNPIALARIIANSNANSIAVNATGTSYASQEEGFPHITMIPEDNGGEAPHGLDFNGFLKMLSSHVFNIQNGIPETFNPAVSSAIGGYPKNAQLWLIDDNNSRYLKSTKDDNTDNFLTNPSVIGTSWVDAFPTKDYVDNGLAAKQNTITGAASTVTTNNLTASRAVVSNGSGKLSVSSTTTVELNYVHGVTSAIQTQINAKAADNAVVHLTGAETITGLKTIRGDGSILLRMQNSYTVKGQTPSNDSPLVINFYDSLGTNNSNILGQVFTNVNTSGEVSTILSAYKNVSGSIDATYMGIVYSADGNKYGFAPASDVNGSILTTVNKSKGSDGYFQLGNGMIVNWFTGSKNDQDTWTFKKPFSNTNYVIVCSPVGAPTNQSSDVNWIVYAKSKSTTAVVLNIKDTDSTAARNGTVQLYAFGY